MVLVYRPEEATWKLSNCLSAMQSLLDLYVLSKELAFSIVGVHYTLPDDHASQSQTNSSTDCIECHQDQVTFQRVCVYVKYTERS